MRNCPKCGCTVFNGTQERKHQVILYGNGVFIRDSGELHRDPIQGPYTCMQCGTEYGSLDDLTEEVGYDSLKVGNLVLAHSMGLPEGTVRANLEKQSKRYYRTVLYWSQKCWKKVFIASGQAAVPMREITRK